MSANVNLDALISREDFEVLSDGDDAPIQQTLAVRDFEHNAFFYGALRKPDFQRETSEWEPKRVAGLIRTFIEGDLIPAVILWKNRDLLFVIDGSHRLSALIAWVQNDYGDGLRSREFFDQLIPDEQSRVAQRTRELIEKEIGSYADHKLAVETPDVFGPDIVSRARRLGSLALQVQWVRGDAKKAEKSFVRINQQAAMITPQELELLQSRKRPNAIAARAVIRRGTGHKYWSGFSPEARRKIEDLAAEVHELIFVPGQMPPVKSLDLPAGGPVYSATALRMCYDFINLCAGTTTDSDDDSGQRTIEYLERTGRVMRLILSNHASSLGLHPAVYFYSWTGKQQPILFLVTARLVVDLERSKRLKEFSGIRGHFEDFLVLNRSLVTQVIRKFGTKESGATHLKGFFEFVLEQLRRGLSASEVVPALLKEPGFSYLQPGESPYDGTAPSRFSTQVKSGIVLRELLATAPRCGICHGFLPSQAISIDHKVRRQDGGLSIPENAQVTHPFCNTGVKN